MTRIVIDNESSATQIESLDMIKKVMTENSDSIKNSRLFLRYFTYTGYVVEVSGERYNYSDFLFTIKDYK